jgi:hypothetical protein
MDTTCSGKPMALQRSYSLSFDRGVHAEGSDGDENPDNEKGTAGDRDEPSKANDAVSCLVINVSICLA